MTDSTLRNSFENILKPSLGPRFALSFAALLICSQFLFGCKSNVEQPVVRKLLVDVDRSAQPTPGSSSSVADEVSREQLQEWVRNWLKDAGSLRLDEKAEEGAVLRVRFSPAPVGKRRGAMGLEAEWVEKKDGKGRRFYGQSEAWRHGSVPNEQILKNAFADALGQVLSVRSAGHLDDVKLAAWLDDAQKTSEQKKRALRVLGNRRSEAGLAMMCKFVENHDAELEAEALIALTRLQPKAKADQERVTQVLIDATAGRSPLMKKQVVKAVERLDTRLGRAWLFTLSTGHPASEVRLAASSALQRLELSDSATDRLQEEKH